MTDRTTSNKSYSQWGDDLLVLEYFSGHEGCTFLEAGANDPILLSQTYLLEQNGWSGALVEPVASCCERLNEVRQGSMIFQRALGAPEDVGILKLLIPDGATELAHEMGSEGNHEHSSKDGEIVEAEFITLNQVLQLAKIEHLNYLSLDLEGMEYRALRGLDFDKYQPDLIVIEDRLNHLKSHHYLRRMGYKLVRRNGSNNWYVPQDVDFKVSLLDRTKHFRKLYLSMPFRWFRKYSRQFRQRFRTN